MADLATSWLGLSLRSPIVLAASPLCRDPDAVACAVDAGASAVVMHSLFEEELVAEQLAVHRFVDARLDADAEARSVLPNSGARFDESAYLRELERLRARVDVPVIASLNGTSPGGWIHYAARLEGAGASALELNLYEATSQVDEPSANVESRQLAVVRAVVESVRVPVSVKLTPFYSSLAAFVRALETQGTRGVAVFNRFYQPDIALDTLDVDRHLALSTSAELPLRLHALARLSPSVTLDLACTGGVHTGRDAAKAILSGAHVVQLASVLLEHGPAHVATIRDELTSWLDGKGYRSSAEARGVMNRASAPDPSAWERLGYARMLEGWRPSRERNEG